MLCAAFMMSRDARPCSPTAFVTSCAIFRIWPVDCASVALPVACCAVAAATSVACSAVAETAVATRPSGDALLVGGAGDLADEFDGVADALQDLAQPRGAGFGDGIAVVGDAQALGGGG